MPDKKTQPVSRLVFVDDVDENGKPIKEWWFLKDYVAGLCIIEGGRIRHLKHIE